MILLQYDQSIEGVSSGPLRGNFHTIRALACIIGYNLKGRPFSGHVPWENSLDGTT